MQGLHRLLVAGFHADHIAQHRSLQGLAQEALTEGFRPTGAQRDPAYDELSAVAQQGIILDGMAQHGLIAPFVLQADPCRELCSDLGDQGTLLRFGPVGWHCEVHPVCICLDQGHAARSQRLQDLIEQCASAPGDLIGGVQIGEEGHRTCSHVAIGGINQGLHGRLRPIVLVGLDRARRSCSRCGLVVQAQVGQPVKNVQQDLQAIARGPNAKEAHERGVQRGHVGFDDVLGYPGGQQIGGAPGMGLTAGLLFSRGEGQRGTRREVGAHEHGFENTHSRSRRGDALIAAWCHPRQGEGCTHEPARETIHLFHIVQGIVTHAFGILPVGLIHL